MIVVGGESDGNLLDVVEELNLKIRLNGGQAEKQQHSDLTSYSFWNVAIPLLSPLETYPTAIERKEQQQQQNQILNHQQGGETDKPIVFKKW
ncbi:hypothetical protein LINPERPRIM_LOCUS5801 [Linum perenne]